MGRYVGIVMYKGLIEDFMTFDTIAAAVAWVAERRGEYGIEETSDSGVWDTGQRFLTRVC